MKTFSAKPQDVQRNGLWSMPPTGPGRLASQIALRLRGKHEPIYTCMSIC